MSQQTEIPTATIWTMESLPLIHPLTGKLQSTTTSLISSTTLYSWTMSYFSVLAPTRKDAFDLAMTIPIVQHTYLTEQKEKVLTKVMTLQMPATTTTIGVTGDHHFMVLSHIPGPFWIVTIKYKMPGPEHPLLSTPQSSSWNPRLHNSTGLDSREGSNNRPESGNNYWTRTPSSEGHQTSSPQNRRSADYNANWSYGMQRTDAMQRERTQYVMIASGNPMWPQYYERRDQDLPRPLSNSPKLVTEPLQPNRKRWRPKTPASSPEKPTLYPDLSSLIRTGTHEQSVNSNSRVIPAPTIYTEPVSHRLTKREMDQRLITFPEPPTEPPQDAVTDVDGAGEKRSLDPTSTTGPSSVSKQTVETPGNNTGLQYTDLDSGLTIDCKTMMKPTNTSMTDHPTGCETSSTGT